MKVIMVLKSSSNEASKATKSIYYYDPLAYKPDEYKDFADKALYLENQNSLIKHLIQLSNQGYNIVSWDYVDLLPFESRSITVTFNVNPTQFSIECSDKCH